MIYISVRISDYSEDSLVSFSDACIEKNESDLALVSEPYKHTDRLSTFIDLTTKSGFLQKLGNENGHSKVMETKILTKVMEFYNFAS